MYQRVFKMDKKLGLIGMPVSHSLSPLIHSFLHNHTYLLFESNTLEIFKDTDILGLNVTAPLKEKAYELAERLDNYATSSRSVNTLLKKDNLIYGYNTDILALKEILNRLIKKIQPKNIGILGNGATSRSVQIALKALPFNDYKIYARHHKTNENSWDDWDDSIDFIINTTPLGMATSRINYPFKKDTLKNVKYIFDVVYSPLKTLLLKWAKFHQIPHQNGLIMLIKQARLSAELFTGKKIDAEIEKTIYKALLLKKVNIVLIGMPYSGKSTFGIFLSKLLNKPLMDTDELITKKLKMTPKEIIIKYGEKRFREIENEVILSLSDVTGSVISTGGGAILDKVNQDTFSKNGLFVWLNKIDYPEFDISRPLTSNLEDYLEIKKQRDPIYQNLADITLTFKDTLDHEKSKWEEAFNDYIHTQWT